MPLSEVHRKRFGNFKGVIRSDKLIHCEDRSSCANAAKRWITGWLVVEDHEGNGLRPVEGGFLKTFDESAAHMLVNEPYTPPVNIDG